jgi:hypothetical protein
MTALALTRNGAEDSDDLTEARALLVYAVYIHQQLAGHQQALADVLAGPLERMRLAVERHDTADLGAVCVAMRHALEHIQVDLLPPSTPAGPVSVSQSISWLIDYGDCLVGRIVSWDAQAARTLRKQLLSCRSCVVQSPDVAIVETLPRLKDLLSGAERLVAASADAMGWA